MKPFFQILPFVLCLSLLAVSASAETVPLPSEYLDFIQSLGPDDPEYTDLFPNEDTHADNEADHSDLFPNEDTHADNEADHSDETVPETEPEAQPEPEKTQEPTFESQDSTPTETDPPETVEPTEVTEASKDPEETISLQELVQSVHNTESACQYIAGFLLFFVVCALCYFSYKFFKIFF